MSTNQHPVMIFCQKYFPNKQRKAIGILRFEVFQEKQKFKGH